MLFLEYGVQSQIKERTSLHLFTILIFLTQGMIRPFMKKTYSGRLMDVSRFVRDPLEDFQNLNKEDKQNFLIILLCPSYLNNV